MNDGLKKPSRFKTVVPLMVYLDPKERESVKVFSKKENMSVSQLSREAFQMRMSDSSDLFNSGFNAGLNEAMKIVNNCQGATMMFPSGKSFARVVCDDIEKFLRDKK
jgi:hypothetical protein